MSARRSRARTLLLLIGVLLAAALPAGPASAGGVGGEFYGINSGSEVFRAGNPLRDENLEAMRARGIRVLRIDASWAAAEPLRLPAAAGRPRYVWRSFDAMVAPMARHGLRWYPMLGYSTAWSGVVPGDMFSAPADPSRYAAFVRAFAQRYGRGGSFWRQHPELPELPTLSYEIWNEPNFDHFWHDQTDAPARYADLYLAARAAVREVDPAADTVVGGLIDTGAEQFVANMYAHRPDLRGRVDAVAFHPYRQRGGAIATIRRMRRALDSAGGRGVPIELTEIGWFKGGRSEESRARVLRRLARVLPKSKLGVTRLMPYVWLGGEWALMNHDGSPMPIGRAYAAAIQTTTGPQRLRLGTPVL